MENKITYDTNINIRTNEDNDYNYFNNYEKPKLRRSVEYYEYYNNDLNYEDECKINELLNKYEKIMILKIYVDSDDEYIIKKYDENILENNKKLYDNNFLDAGFDILNPEDFCCEKKLIKYDLKIKCSASIKTDKYKFYNTGFYLYPRSSIVKTPLRLSNSVGIIDSGYRNNLISVYDNLSDKLIDPYKIEKYSRLVQICCPSLSPIYVLRVDNVNELSEKTERDMGGFGSTGL